MKTKLQDYSFSTPERIRMARFVAGFSKRTDFCEAVGIPLPTVESWEKKGHRLSSKGAKRLVAALETVGVLCSEEWLFWGTGFFPRKRLGFHADGLIDGDKTKRGHPEKGFFKEVSSFLSQNPSSVVLYIADNQMYPFYERGDYVGGIQLFDSYIEKALKFNCIIEKKDGSVVVRRLEERTDGGHYSLFCYAPEKNYSFSQDFNVEIKSVSPIIWHRKTLRFSSLPSNGSQGSDQN